MVQCRGEICQLKLCNALKEDTAVRQYNISNQSLDNDYITLSFNALSQVTLRTQQRGEAMFGDDWESRVVERFCK